MPENTPIYGFTFPCPGDLITAGSFTTLANQIDTKLVDVNNDLTFALNRPNVDQTETSVVQTIAAGVDTVLTVPSSLYTIPMAGVWIVRAMINTFSAATVNMMRGRIRQNGVVRYSYTTNTEGNNTGPVFPVGPIVAAAGDAISLQFLFNGAGTMDVFATLSAKMIVRIP